MEKLNTKEYDKSGRSTRIGKLRQIISKIETIEQEHLECIDLLKDAHNKILSIMDFEFKIIIFKQIKI